MPNVQRAHRSLFSSVLMWLETRSQHVLILLAILLDVLLGLLDWITGTDFAFSIFYLLPVLLTVRCSGLYATVLMSFICAGTWLAADLGGGHAYSHPAFAYWTFVVRFAFFLIIGFSFQRLRCFVESLRELASTEPLTGAANSRAFYQMAQTEIERSVRYGRPFTTSYFDLDNFKVVNDTMGHNVGDDLLVLTVQLINQNIRPTDFLARLGGDEFVILFSETNLEAAQHAIYRIVVRFHSEMELKGLPVTLSVGLVTFLCPPVSVSEMIQMADKLMYEAKKGGKNRIISATYSKEGLKLHGPKF